MKGLFIGITLILFAELTGFYAITSYAVTTFQKAGTTIDPYKSSITLAVALIFGSLATASLADKLGRKALILTSLLGAALGLFTVAGYHYATLCGYDLSSFAWVPMVSLSTVIFLASAGIIPLCYICCVETIPTKVRLSKWMFLCCCSFSHFHFFHRCSLTEWQLSIFRTIVSVSYRSKHTHFCYNHLICIDFSLFMAFHAWLDSYFCSSHWKKPAANH